MLIEATGLTDVLLIKPEVYSDHRGYLYESFNQQKFSQLGLQAKFVQDNISKSSKNVLRGLHFQKKQPQGKLIQVLSGEIFDVAVDINPESSSFGAYFATILSEQNHNLLWIGPNYAHGFCVLSDSAIVHYKCTTHYDTDDDAGIAWNCPLININWPIKKPILSTKDKQQPNLQKYLQR